MSNIKNFFDISDLSSESLKKIINGDIQTSKISNKNIGLIFEKSSTRTRLSFISGLNDLGANPIEIKLEDLNLSRYESFEDTFRAMNCYLDGLIFRTDSHNKLIEANKFFDKPIINALSEKSHPCQIISDLYTLTEVFGNLNIKLLWMGDMNNVCFSLVEAANLIKELELVICSPEEITSKTQWQINENIKILNNLNEVSLSEINCVMTDVFISMNDDDDIEKTKSLLSYKVDANLMSMTNQNCVFMHCLPAKVGAEVTEEVFRGPQSIVWKQAYNRMVAQRNLMQLIYQ